MSENKITTSTENEEISIKMVVIEGEKISTVKSNGTTTESRGVGTDITKLTPEIERRIIELVNDNSMVSTSDIVRKLNQYERNHVHDVARKVILFEENNQTCDNTMK
ncbi:hypothetical protein RF11_12027 [Thelohanellus kitauei]|uniref:Uncharacterized protein n=1 Tax=Thelohanellus kitauei TaxID=669202 RepID=A0A0C2MX70_THEKT|nr:hypothetical protein RF11_12027 [Thelohanellus kitauei]